MQNVCIYCGANAGNDPRFATAAESLARTLAERRIGVVYGGASVGLMGVVADAALAAGGNVVGVIPQALIDKELAHDELTRLEVVTSMHERKARMVELADAFIALPGGLGTLDELFEILTWGQLGFHRKPCGVLNVNGYYDSLLVFLDHAVDSGLLRPAFRAMLLCAAQPEALLVELTRYTAPAVPRWVDASGT